MALIKNIAAKRSIALEQCIENKSKDTKVRKSVRRKVWALVVILRRNVLQNSENNRIKMHKEKETYEIMKNPISLTNVTAWCLLNI